MKKKEIILELLKDKPNLKIILSTCQRDHSKIRRWHFRHRNIWIRSFKRVRKNLQNKINIRKKLNFGNANLVVAVPDDWIDVQTIADLEEVSFDLKFKRNSRLRVATKYPNLTNDFLISKGVTQYKIIPSLGATETYPFIGSSEIITDITSTGKTLTDNNLRVLKDGLIFKILQLVCFLQKKRL